MDTKDEQSRDAFPLQVLGNHDYGGHECDSCLFEGGTGGCSGAQIGYDDEKTWEFPAGGLWGHCEADDARSLYKENTCVDA